MSMADAPRVEWDDFARRFRYRQDEHVSLIGPTGTGKTTLARELLLPRRKWVLAFGTKPSDPTLDQLVRKGGFERLKRVPDIVNGRPRKVLIWPKTRGIEPRELELQRSIIAPAWSDAYGVGGWTMFADEMSYLVEHLRMARPAKITWQQGRSSNVSLIAATQRPAWVPRDIYSAATHLFFWNTNDGDDLKRISGLNGLNSQAVRKIVAGLDRGGHEFLYVNTKSATMARSVFRPGK